jgi:hypothetical protein
MFFLTAFDYPIFFYYVVPEAKKHFLRSVPLINRFFTAQVPVQRVTKYPLLLSRLLKVTPADNPDRDNIR